MKARSKRPRVESSKGDASWPPLSGDPSTEEFVDLTAAVDPLPSSLSDASLRSMLNTVMTVQAAHGQILVDVLEELQALQSPPSPPFDDEP